MRKVIQGQVPGHHQSDRHQPWRLIFHINQQHADIASRLADEVPQTYVEPSATLRRNILRALHETESSSTCDAGFEPLAMRARSAASLVFACTLLVVVTAGIFVQQGRYNTTKTAMHHTTPAAASSSATARWFQQLFNDTTGAREDEIETPLLHEMRALMQDANRARDFVLNNVPFAARLTHSKNRGPDGRESSLNATMQ